MATTGGARLHERAPSTGPRTSAEPRLLTVSAAARLLGVSSSSLRAWAAAGRVPHVRTPGGHRRFELDELVRWLSERGGAPPAPQQRLQELVPTRVEAMPETARALADSGDEVLAAFEEELARTRPSGASRPSAARQTRVLGALEALAAALDSGDLAGAYRDAEWEGFRHGASGQAGDAPVTEALALRRAVDRVLGPILGARPAEQRAVERSLDRMAVRVAAGYADGVRCRLRSTLE
ncbi:MAG TPA: helix-turn-helix domain-containing protein [Miltoncostaea sp.]|nr:helix-turn-helix domain-containing protein [Miltoncostaea sp.]